MLCADFRTSILSQMGSSHWPRRYSRRAQGISEMRHQRNRQRRHYQNSTENRKGRRRYRGVSNEYNYMVCRWYICSVYGRLHAIPVTVVVMIKLKLIGRECFRHRDRVKYFVRNKNVDFINNLSHYRADYLNSFLINAAPIRIIIIIHVVRH